MKKWISVLLALLLALPLAACAAPAEASPAQPPPAADARPTVDRSGAALTLPETIESIVVMAPSITEILVALDCGDRIIATDTQSLRCAGVAQDLPAFDMMSPDAEQLAALNPDVIFVSGMSASDGTNPFAPLTALGICVIDIPTSDSLQAIEDDITFLAAVLDKQEQGAALNRTFRAELDRIAAIGKTVTEPKTVYFEIAAAPYAYSFGTGVFLDEMLTLLGAKNALAGQSGWLSVEAESIVAANPDVILTNVTYVDDPVGEILGRAGWEQVTAVKNQDVYAIDNLSSSLANQNVVKALGEMARAIYPELYGK